MAFFQGILLGTIQGLTEFLPVSSSGHLVIAGKLLGLNQDSLTTNALLHLGTLIAVIIYFRHELSRILSSVWQWVRWNKKDSHSALAGYLLAATVPAAAGGALFEKFFSDAFDSTFIVGIMLLTTGAVLWTVESKELGVRNLDSMKLSDSVWVGLAQLAAIMPGLSRSGVTIAAGIWCGLEREEAARFSFLLSIPIIIGASVVSISRGQPLVDVTSIIAGMIAAGLSGFLAIAVLMKVVQEKRLRLFAVYCFIVGSIAIILTLKQ
ncbi:MAG TPA: undecaprenyl-diphosphate phosphatase [Actinobacteria bacterium]|nr:undecaprenyl-diphosphate phosphatase [Actinomycetota bacterium]